MPLNNSKRQQMGFTLSTSALMAAAMAWQMLMPSALNGQNIIRIGTPSGKTDSAQGVKPKSDSLQRIQAHPLIEGIRGPVDDSIKAGEVYRPAPDTTDRIRFKAHYLPSAQLCIFTGLHLSIPVEEYGGHFSLPNSFNGIIVGTVGQMTVRTVFETLLTQSMAYDGVSIYITTGGASGVRVPASQVASVHINGTIYDLEFNRHEAQLKATVVQRHVDGSRIENLQLVASLNVKENTCVYDTLMVNKESSLGRLVERRQVHAPSQSTALPAVGEGNAASPTNSVGPSKSPAVSISPAKTRVVTRTLIDLPLAKARAD